MYLPLTKDNIRKNYSAVKDRLEDTYREKTVRTDVITLKPIVMDSIDDTTGMVCVYGSLVLPRFSKWFIPYDDVTLTAQEPSYRAPDPSRAIKFSPDMLIYGKVSDLTSTDDGLLLRTFGINPHVPHESRIGSHNIRNLLHVGQNGSFKEDGLYTILVNEERMHEAFLKRHLSKTA